MCLSDMGTEIGIADAPDVVGACLGQPEKDTEGTFMFPNALNVPCPQHIIDLSVRAGLDALRWWPEWQAHAKAVCQWLRPSLRRDALRARLETMEDRAVVEALRKALPKRCASVCFQF